jgi:hypothetical protein
VIGRHPCLTLDQLARLVGIAVDRVRRLENELIRDGLLRRIDFVELPRGATVLTSEEFSALGLVEITSAGRRRLAGWLGLGPAAATRYHGLTGNGRGDAGRRWRGGCFARSPTRSAPTLCSWRLPRLPRQ